MSVTKDGHDRYLPLRDYGVLSDMRSVALVSSRGSVDWWAMPLFDTPPVCAAVLDPDAGGSVSLAPSVEYRASRRYVPGTLVMETRFTTDGGTVSVRDALNLGSIGLLPWVELARVVTAEEGEVPMEWHVAPGTLLQGKQPWAFVRDGLAMLAAGECHLAVVTEGAGEPVVGARQISGDFVARRGTPALVCVTGTAGEPAFPPKPETVRQRLDTTVDRWQGWSQQVGYEGQFRDAVVRSALTIKALTLQSTGGIAAAATTSLPEKIGGSRNFDYRFAWIRDGAFALDAMGRLGLDEELHAGASWLLGATSRNAPDVKVFYSVEGEVLSPEMQEAPAPGYRESQPVHLGNSAAAQKQLGAYGDMVDALWRYVGNGGHLDASSARMLAAMADQVCEEWRTPDAGLWELGQYEHYTSSKINCWTALDRAVRLARSGQMASLNVARWEMERDAIHDWVYEHCWSTAKQAFTFYAGTDDLDAAVLLAARTEFCAGDDPRLATTIDAIRSELTAEGPLLYRYSGMRDKEGAFLACSCWLVEALAHTGRVGEAKELLEAFWARANDVGMLTEEMDPASGEMLGNIPQALSHLAVIGAATSIARAERR